jgi:spore maturation protein B
LVLLIVLYGLYKKIDLYESFVEGSKEAFKMSYTIFPNLLAMILSVNILMNSGFLKWIVDILFGSIKLPIEIISLIVTKPISGSAAIALINTIYSKYGVDSFYSILASTIQGCTDTTFYVIALYYGSVGIKKTRYALVNSLFGDFIGIVTSIVLCYLLFS